ncbi:olfactory receptor 8K3-like [Sminthopsis crassicaudata]|uniref:olfactory receptor 8K3-like n=1 Tax=Sminthopsis crassicaudata TaxID=9301 RepID=UPI003D688D89
MEEMDKWNETTSIQITEFILMGITDHHDLQIPLFLVFLINYLAIVFGNLGLIILTNIDSHLKTPMYFFLRNLAFIDLDYSTAIGPKMLVNLVVEENVISYTGCATQLVVFVTLIISELFILSVMAYDRYVAICNPLLYMVIMSDRMCYLLVTIPYLYSTFVALLVTIKIFNSSFWKSNIISHFYCDSLPLLNMLSSDTEDIALIILSLSAFNLVFSLLVVLVSYGLILMAILRMNSAQGRHKAFSTCGSHLTVVVVFYATLLYMYLQPYSSHSFDTDKMASVFYTLVIPMLNPLIYSLRNKEVKGALKRALESQCKCLT